MKTIEKFIFWFLENWIFIMIALVLFYVLAAVAVLIGQEIIKLINTSGF